MCIQMFVTETKIFFNIVCGKNSKKKIHIRIYIYIYKKLRGEIRSPQQRNLDNLSPHTFTSMSVIV